MPAASESPGRAPGPRLPRTWRPFGARIAASVGGFGLLAVCLVCWFAFDDSVRAEFTVFDKLTMFAIFLMAFAAWWALIRSRVVAETGRLVVINGFRRHEYDYAEILAIHLSRGAPWAVLDLSDGTSMSALALQGSDGDRARTAVRQIRKLLR